ncbi:MAG: hypothetical protein KJZ87_03170 [Thermoguttaceae bacterium]|nr:hypothetical protein [Thermoguttaceae bacterium]
MRARRRTPRSPGQRTLKMFFPRATCILDFWRAKDYPTCVTNGWQIGSGPVESVCKTVVGNRLLSYRLIGQQGRPTGAGFYGESR